MIGMFQPCAIITTSLVGNSHAANTCRRSYQEEHVRFLLLMWFYTKILHAKEITITCTSSCQLELINHYFYYAFQLRIKLL